MKNENVIVRYGQALVENCRVQEPRSAPEWVLHCIEKLGDMLIERHLCRSRDAWGLAKSAPNQILPYDEVGSRLFLMYAKDFHLFEKVGGWDEVMKQKTIRFWQAWQNPDTGRFRDPRDSTRIVNEKYITGLLHDLGAAPLYPFTTTSTSGQIETKTFLQRTKDDPDWQAGGWGVGSHTALMAVEICRAVAKGREDLIPDLEQGLQNIYSHQDPNSGLWGPPQASLAGRIGGALKVIGRTYFHLGMVEFHTSCLIDSLIEHQNNGDFYNCSRDMCIERNVCEVTAYCLEVSSYRRTELHGVLERLVEIMREHINPDGSVSWNRGDAAGGGGNAIILTYPLGICGAYLRWENCPFPNPLPISRGLVFPWRPVLLRDGTVKMTRQALLGD